MTDDEREALVERMTDAAADAYMDNEWITFTAAMRAAIRAALAVEEQEVREDEREGCLAIVATWSREGHSPTAHGIDEGIRARGAA